MNFKIIDQPWLRYLEYIVSIVAVFLMTELKKSNVFDGSREILAIMKQFYFINNLKFKDL